jgi:hypothetical protein
VDKVQLVVQSLLLQLHTLQVRVELYNLTQKIHRSAQSTHRKYTELFNLHTENITSTVNTKSCIIYTQKTSTSNTSRASLNRNSGYELQRVFHLLPSRFDLS